MNVLTPLPDLAPPCCGNCPHAWAPGDGNTYCRRYPPVSENVPIPVASLPKEQQLRLPAEAARQGFVMMKQSSFPATQPAFVCGEHPDFDLDGEDEPEKPLIASN